MGTGLLEGEDVPAIVENEGGSSPVLLICEHAGKRIPAKLGTLGLPDAEIARHIGWDIGAAGVARGLAELIDAPCVLQRYSRLVYDCNRPPGSPGAMPEVSETTPVPGNRNLPEADRLARIEEIYRPFHAAIGTLIDARMRGGIGSVIVTIHSFTPVFKGVRRDLDFGVLHDEDARLADAMLAHAGRWRGIVARRNEPYGPADGVCHTLNMHAGARGLAGAMLEIRNDLIADQAGQAAWAARLAELIEESTRLFGGSGLEKSRASA
jgi:predicted N-formylglutamate amidohydrolase